MKERDKMQRGLPDRPRKNKKLERYIIVNEERFKDKLRNKTIDIEEVRRLASIGCTLGEMAMIFGCSHDYIEAASAKDPLFASALEEGYGELRQSLRHMQVQVAKSGNTGMLIWLGKQYLGQSDKQEIDKTTTISITVKDAMKELQEIPKDQLLAARSLLRGEVIEGQAIEIKGDAGEKGGGGTPV